MEMYSLEYYAVLVGNIVKFLEKNKVMTYEDFEDIVISLNMSLYYD